MKKEYIKPTANVMELDYTGMLCTSAKAPQTPKFNTTDTHEVTIHKSQTSVWDGEVL